MDGYWDNTPELEFPEPRRRKKKRPPADNDVVYYTKVRCPKCGSDKCPVYDSSHLPIRYHKCCSCGFAFKSVEKKQD